MPSRLYPDLERAIPSDSDPDPPGYRIVRQLREVLFRDGQWRAAELQAQWTDRSGRRVIQSGSTARGLAGRRSCTTGRR